MIVVPFNHSEILKSWLSHYQKTLSLIDQLPEIGFISEEDGVYYAAGFLRRIESCSQGMLDGLIVNPRTFGKKRYNSLNFIVERIIIEAKSMGLVSLVALSIDKATLKRSERFGFEKLPHIGVVLDLSRGV